MILPIYILGQPVLRKVAEDIPTDYSWRVGNCFYVYAI